jgi:hypothetical protein
MTGLSAKVSRKRRRVARAASASTQKQLLSWGSAHCSSEQGCFSTGTGKGFRNCGPIREKARIRPVMKSGQAELVATDYAFDDGVWIEPWKGHTPGHICILVGSPQASVVLSGDIMHTPGVPRPAD